MIYGICTNRPAECWKSAKLERIPMRSPNQRCPSCGFPLEAQETPEGPLDKVRNAVSQSLGSFRLDRNMALIGLGAFVLVVILAGVFMSGVLKHRAGLAGNFGSGGYLIRLSGSNTIGSELGPKLVEAWLASKGATDVKDVERTGPDGAKLDEREISATLDGKTVKVEVKAHGSATAFKDLAAGTADIGMASRAIKDDEVAKLANLGDMRSATSEHVLALDGIAVIVPQSNPVAHLTLAQLKGLFTGQIHSWADVGAGNLGDVHLYARDDKSGTFDAFKALALGGAPLGEAKRYEDSATLESDVASDPGGIGFIGMPYVKTTRAVPVSDGEAPPLQPTVLTVKTEAYALARRLFLYTSANPTNEAVKDFLEFAASGAGQRVVRTAQFVDLDLTTPLAKTSEPSTDCRLSPRWTGDPNDYCRLRASAQQLGTSFRFKSGSVQLDNRALSDLKRVLEAVENKPDQGLILAGFADASGTHAANCALAKSRAQKVADALATLGLTIKSVVGFCDEQQVRDNATEAGRELNRRVEIYVG